ncbi:MAG: HAD family phosphatase [Lactimicrobium sp.]|jgi:HAD superfamily hydrolase (TIGR01509 family)|uniref:HAD family hydrolase n=1 Tax=Lactimicrobium sp. TaxID=2563780 RepID=UPI002F3532DE
MLIQKQNRIACIFDADGTLLDSMGFWCDLARQYLHTKGIDVSAQINTVVKDMSLPQSSAFLHERYLPALTPERIQQEIIDMIHQAYAQKIPLKPGVYSFLSALKEKNMPMCVVSTSDEDLLHACFARTGILPFFSFVLTPGNGKEDKTVPDLYLRACDRMHTEPYFTFVFEDTLVPVMTAEKAGFRVIGVKDVWSKGDWNVIENTADLWVDGLQEQDQILAYMRAVQNH